MGTIKDKLQKSIESKDAIKAALIAKGVENVGDVLAEYPSKIASIPSGGKPTDGGWQPNPTWWDIESIIQAPENQLEGYNEMIVWLLSDSDVTTTLNFGALKYKTSDDEFYDTNGVVHTWDTSKDKQCIENGISTYKTRYIIGYGIKSYVNYASSIYIVLKGDKMLLDSWGGVCKYTECVKYLGKPNNHVIRNYHILQGCWSLRKLINCNIYNGSINGYSFNSMANIETLNISDSELSSKLPAFGELHSLTSFTGYDMSAVTTSKFTPKFHSVRYMEITGIGIDVDLSFCKRLNHDSLMFIINNAQTVAEPKILTLGAENLAKLSEEEKAIATNKGWTLA